MTRADLAELLGALRAPPRLSQLAAETEAARELAAMGGK